MKRNYVMLEDWSTTHEALEEAQRIDASTIRCNSMDNAEDVAKRMTALTGNVWFAYESSYAFSQFVAAEAPKVGDPISYQIGSDRYPCGYIAKVSKSLHKVESEDGLVFYRQKKRPSVWLANGCRPLLHGHHRYRDPHF